MDHDTDLAADAATDLTARLDAELNVARARLRAAELHLEHLTDPILEGAIDYPIELVRQVRAARFEVEALEHVLADLGAEVSRAACA